MNDWLFWFGRRWCVTDSVEHFAEFVACRTKGSLEVVVLPGWVVIERSESKQIGGQMKAFGTSWCDNETAV